MLVLNLILLVLLVATTDASLFDGDTTLTPEEQLVGIQIESDLSNRYEKHTFLSTSDGSGSALFWKVDNEEIQFAIAVHTIGWVGLGISEAGGMIGSDIMLFERMTNEVIDSYVIEDKGAGPLVDDCQDWTLVNATILEDEGWMIIEVKRALDTLDTQDIPIVNDEELWSAPTRIIAAWGDDTQSVSYHGQNKARASIRLFAKGDESADDGVELREALEEQADGSFEVSEVDYVIPAKETTYHDICATYDDLFEKDAQDENGVAMIGAVPFFSEDTEQYIQHFHHFTVYVAESCESTFPRTMVYVWAPGK